MGLLLDSTVLIAGDRRKLSAEETLREIKHAFPGEDEFGISVISVMEFAHGESRAETPLRAIGRSQFLDDILSSIDVAPCTTTVARRAGRLDGELAARGVRLAFPDILIGVTAIELGWPILTANLRHFNRIPGLSVVHRP
jgi:predicted nucleic acid-binding protein